MAMTAWVKGLVFIILPIDVNGKIDVNKQSKIFEKFSKINIFFWKFLKNLSKK